MGFFDGAGGALLGGIGGSLLGGIFGNSAQKSANRTNLAIAEMNNRANRELAEYSYSKDLEQWNRQNEYNLPINQMRRYEDAGLNPNLIYGQGDNGNAKSSPSYPTPTMQSARVQPVNAFADSFAQIGNMLGQFQNLKLVEAQVKNEQAKTDYINSQTNLNNAKSLYQSFSNRLFGDTFDSRVDYFRLRNDIMSWDKDFKKGAILNQESQRSYLDALTKSVQNKNSIWDDITVPYLRVQLGDLEQKLIASKTNNAFRRDLNQALLELRRAQTSLTQYNSDYASILSRYARKSGVPYQYETSAGKFLDMFGIGKHIVSGGGYLDDVPDLWR